MPCGHDHHICWACSKSEDLVWYRYAPNGTLRQRLSKGSQVPLDTIVD